MKNKNGFTVFEFLAFLFLVVIIVIILMPYVSKKFDEYQKTTLISKANKIMKAVEKKYSGEEKVYAFENKKEVSTEKLNYLGAKPQNGVIIVNKDGQIALAFHDGTYCVEKKYDETKLILSEKSLVECKVPFVDDSGASTPTLKNGMIPVVWNGENWVKADISTEWYNYNKKMWANVVLVTEATRAQYMNESPGIVIYEDDVLAYFVWIPRYRYKLFNVESIAMEAQTIEVEFESKGTPKSTGTNNGEWLTHPAFTFGDEELDGIWVGKFETTGTRSKPTVKPNMEALSYQNIGKIFEIAKNFNNPVLYGLTEDTDTHVMKNTEWGAVAYLAYSQYGKNSEIWVNPTNKYITGCAGETVSTPLTNECLFSYNTKNGMQASTTGNIYGIYDMSGGTAEYVMGGMYNSTGTDIMLGLATFKDINNPDLAKYIDKYQYGLTSTDQAAYNRRILGDATGETRCWNGDNAEFIMDIPIWNGYGDFWFIRGGYYNDKVKAGIFSFSKQNGDTYKYNGFRVVIPGNE